MPVGPPAMLPLLWTSMPPPVLENRAWHGGRDGLVSPAAGSFGGAWRDERRQRDQRNAGVERQPDTDSLASLAKYKGHRGDRRLLPWRRPPQ